MNQLLDLIERSPRLTANSKRAYKLAVSNFLASTGGRVSPALVEHWRDGLLAHGIKGQTVNLYLCGLKYASRRFAELGLGPDFARGAEKVRAEARRAIRPLSVEEARRLVLACSGRKPVDLRDLALVVLFLRTGMRRSSVTGKEGDPRWPGIRFEDLRGHELAITIKGGRRHTMRLDEETLIAMRPWMTWLGRSGIRQGAIFRSFPPASLEDEAAGVVRIRAGLSACGLSQVLTARAKKAGIPGFHLHRLRHTFISWARAAHIADWKIAEVTGHAAREMLDHYSKDMSPVPAQAALPALMKGSP